MGAIRSKPLVADAITPNDHDEPSIRSRAKLQADIIVDAFSCDRTRVAELGVGCSGSAHVGLMGLESGTRNWHEVAHMSLNDATRALDPSVAGATVTSNRACIQFDRLWVSHVAYLARRLAAIPGGEGSMLDNTLIYWGAESGTDHNHSPHDMQYLLIGGKTSDWQSVSITARSHQQRRPTPHQRPTRLRLGSARLRHRANLRSSPRRVALSAATTSVIKGLRAQLCSAASRPRKYGRAHRW